jgi:hypothetical protein
MKALILIIFMTISLVSNAVVYWPGIAAPCNTTLQACVDASSSGEVIELITNDTIQESVTTVKPISLIAAIGFKPKFGLNHSVTIAYNSGLPGTVTLKGLSFNRGNIEFIHSVSEVTLNILNNNFFNDEETSSPIFVQSFSTSDLKVNIKYNQINSYVLSTGLPSTYGAISLLKNSSSGNIHGDIYSNTLKVSGDSSKGIVLTTEGSGAGFDINITANEIIGGSLGGIVVDAFSSSGINEIDIVSNALLKYDNSLIERGILILSNTGNTNVDLINNTVIHKFIGIAIEKDGGVLSSNIYNNIVAYSGFAGFSIDGGPTISNDYNFTSYNESHFNYTPGPNAIIGAEPRFINSKNARLRADSAAIDAGYPLALLFVVDAPEVDADGLLRVKKSTNLGSPTIDIGAYEAGDFSFKHITNSDNTTSHSTRIDSTLINDISTLDNLQITSNRGLNLSAPMNNDYVGIWYSSGFWRIFNQSFQSLFDGTIFNVINLGSNANTFEHIVSMTGFNLSQINRVGLNGATDKILQLSQHWKGIYNPHPAGIFNDGSNWYVKNFDSQNLPLNANFNIYFQDESKSAFEHVAVADNTYTFSTQLDHPLLNETPCAQIQVTQSGSQGIFNSSPIGVSYSDVNERWHVINQDESSIPLNSAFHILINPGQIADCSDLIFDNGFN